MKMLKKFCNIFFTFSKNDIISLEMNDKQDIMQWLTQMSSGIVCDEKEHVKWDSAFPTRPIIMSSFNTEQLTSIYCLSKENDTKLLDQIKKGNLIIASEGQEVETLSSLFFEDFQFTKHIFYEISSWNDLEKYTSPCTDIIIVDPYLLSSPELYNYNIYSLIKVLSKRIKDSKLNIVIFTLNTQYDKNTKLNLEPDWDTIYSKIRKCAEKHTSFNVTFVTASKTTLQEHDRTIFTNYKFFTSGDTYNFFSSTGEILTNGRNLYVHSNVSKTNAEISKRFLKDMQKIIDRIKSKNNSSLIKKDKKCNFLKF